MSTTPQHHPWKQWSCDQLTPNLCDDLKVESGILPIRSIPVKYWRYIRRTDKKEGHHHHQPYESYHDNDNDDNTISNTTIIVLHGGPSWPHSYLLPLKQLACRGAEVIFYDQAGCGESVPSSLQNNNKNESSSVIVSPSDHPHLLDPAYYSEEELPALIDHWKLDNYHILGHSWGTILAQLFALNSSSNNNSGSLLKSLILSGPLSDAKSYIAAQWDSNEGNLGSLPPFVQGRVKELESKKAYDTPEYEAIDNVLTTFFTVRTAPPPDCFTSSADGLNKEIYVGMQGASEFAIGGVLGDFNVTGRLHELDIPVLLTHGAFDTMRPSIVKTMERRIKLSERVRLPHSGHVSMIDDAGLMNDAVADFLQRVERVGVDRFVPRVVLEEEVMADHRSLSPAMQALFTFVVGIVIGRLCNGNRGYRQI